MKTTFSASAIILFLLAASTGYGQSALSQVYQQGTKLYVYAPTGLNLRDKPDLSGKVLTRVLFQSELEVINAEKSALFEVDGIPGTWVHVKFNNQEGYLFDGYLSRFAPDKDAFRGLENMLAGFLTEKSRTKSADNVIALGDVESGPEVEYNRIDYEEGVIYERIRYANDMITVMFPKGIITTQEMFLFCTVFFTTWQQSENKCKYNAKAMKCTEGHETGTLELKGGPVWWTIRFKWIGGD